MLFTGRPPAVPAPPDSRPAPPGSRPAAPGSHPAAPGSRPAAPDACPALPGSRPALSCSCLMRSFSCLIRSSSCLALRIRISSVFLITSPAAWAARAWASSSSRAKLLLSVFLASMNPSSSFCWDSFSSSMTSSWDCFSSSSSFFPAASCFSFSYLCMISWSYS